MRKNNSQNYLDQAFYRIGETSDSWSVRPIVQPDQNSENDLSGLWWAGNNDSGWGISLSFVQRQGGQDVVAIVYFYDELGNPRWLIGNQSNFITGQAVNIEMKQLNGYGREQNYVELTEIPAGNITLILVQASKEFGQAGTLSMDINYPEDMMNNNYWQRDNIPIALFSKPK